MLTYIIVRLQSAVEKADPELARSLIEEPPRPGEPFVREYLDRLMAALQERIDTGDLRRYPALRTYARMIPDLQILREAAEKGL